MNGPRFYYYIDYGSGWEEMHPYDNQLKLSLRREINPVIQRKNLSGQFSLIESEYDDAFSYFFTSVNDNAPIQIYENGTSGTGTLVYEGWASISGEDNAGEKIITFNDFKTNDQYTDLLDIIKNTRTGEQMSLGSIIEDFTIQGVNSNCDKLVAYSWSSPNFSISGNGYSLGITGRPCSTVMNGAFVIYDDHTKTLRSFDFNGTDFSPSTSGTILDIGAILSGDYGAASVCTYDTDEVVLIISKQDIIRKYQATTGTWTLSSEVSIYNTQYPSITTIDTTTFALVDDKTKQLTTLDSSLVKAGLSLELGDVKKPKIASINTNVIALIDDNIRQIQAYTYSAGVWSKTGQALALPVIIDASICKGGTNIAHIHDTYSGKIYYYSFSGTAWTLTGTGTSLTGGYASTIANDGTYTFTLLSDSYQLDSRITPTIPAIVENILDWYSPTTTYDLDGATCGSSIDIDSVYYGNLETLKDIGIEEITPSNNYDYSIEESLKWMEIFQDFWHLVLDTGTYYIEFLQPNLFSSVGTDIDITTYAPDYNQRIFIEDYKIKREKLIFNNQVSGDFVGDWITYEKNTDVELITPIPLTTDMGFIRNALTGRTLLRVNYSGLFAIYIDSDSYAVYCPAGTSPLSNANVKNEALSTTRIYEDYMKDYRYAFAGSFELNGNTVNVQDTCRNIIDFPTIRLSNGLANFPSSIGSLTGGTYSQYITNLTCDLNSYEFTVDSILLDL